MPGIRSRIRQRLLWEASSRRRACQGCLLPDMIRWSRTLPSPGGPDRCPDRTECGEKRREDPGSGVKYGGFDSDFRANRWNVGHVFPGFAAHRGPFFFQSTPPRLEDGRAERLLQHSPPRPSRRRVAVHQRALRIHARVGLTSERQRGKRIPVRKMRRRRRRTALSLSRNKFRPPRRVLRIASRRRHFSAKVFGFKPSPSVGTASRVVAPGPPWRDADTPV